MELTSNQSTKIFALIVSYFPNVLEIVTKTKDLLMQVDKIILIENGSDILTQELMQSQLNDKRIQIVFLKENCGLGKAQNIAIRLGMNLGADFFLFLDDDSRIKSGSIELLIKEFEINSKVGIVACNILHTNSKKIQKYWIKSKYFYKRVSFTESIHKLENVNTIISSGSLVSRQVIERCGFMREDYFIDYIDIEYCLRVRANGYSITVIRLAELKHKLGNTKSVKVGSIFFHPTNHSPNRRFYMVRNRIWTWKLYAFLFPGWFIIDFGNLIADTLRLFIIEKNRFENFKQFLAGIKEGIFRKGLKI